MAVVWEWLGDYQLERQIEIVPLLSPNNTDHGGSVTFEEYAPTETFEFVANGLTWTEVQALITAAKVRKSTYDVTDKLGRSWTGYIKTLKPTNINGTELFEVRITLLVPPESP